MKKNYKLLLRGIAAICLFILAIVLFITVSSYFSKRQIEKELAATIKKCDSIQIITEQPEISFSGFKENEINSLKFEIKREKKIFSDTVIRNKFSYVSEDRSFKKIRIPFPEFLKTDTIIVTTRNNLKFYISNFHHTAGLHYGMFGPVGVSDCALDEDFDINGSHGNSISKNIALIESEKNKRIKIINATDKEIEVISKNSKISLKMAEEIFYNNRKNKHLLSQIFCGIHIEKTGNYYVFEEEREDKNRATDIITINAENGNYKRYSDYPYQ